jgi:hypothetical protein
MSSADWLFVAILAGALTIMLCADWLRGRRNRRADAPCGCWMCTQTRQHRRERERLP